MPRKLAQLTDGRDLTDPLREEPPQGVGEEKDPCISLETSQATDSSFGTLRMVHLYSLNLILRAESPSQNCMWDFFSG